MRARKTATFQKLFLPHLDGAYNLARWIVERDPDAQAVVQEAYIQAWNEFAESREADARVWLLTIVRKVAYTWIEKRGNHSSTMPFEIHCAPLESPQAGHSHEKPEPQIREALSRMPVEFRELLVLHEVEGWSYKQLASALNAPLAMVIFRLSQAWEQLRREVAGLQF
jgi:RNA polymerase sigma-70 factor (ECF subfamily)